MTVEDHPRLQHPAKERYADGQLVDEEDVERLEVGDRLQGLWHERRERQQERKREVKLTEDGEDDVQRLKDGPRQAVTEDMRLERA